MSTAAKVDKLKNEFVSIISHQMRTPLSAIKWNLETLLENKKGQPLNRWQTSKLEETYQRTERLINLVDDLANLAKIDAGRVQLKLDSLDLPTLFKEVIAQTAIYAKANNVDISLALPAKLPLVRADRNKILQVLDNLVNNAIKYSRGRGQVKITGQAEGSLVVFSLADQGIGIPAAEQPRIFEKFFRASNASASQTEGTGLGLYVARRIVELHGGRMWFESTADQGTTFYFSLPQA